MAQTSSAKSYSVLAVMLILACIVVGYLVISKYYPSYTIAQTSLANVEAENARLKNALASSGSFLAAYKSQSTNSSLLNLALPVKNSDMANFVSSLSQLAAQSGMVLSTFSVNSESQIGIDPNAIKSEELSIGITGTYLAFKDFMLRLEGHLRLIDVYQVTLSADKVSGSGDLPLTYSLRLRTYYQQ